MVTLGEFAGLIITDFLQARKISDACSTAISEEYHVNPLLEGLPVPRYIIDEAEIDVPLQIAGVQKSEFKTEDKDKLLKKIERYLPTLLYRNIKNSYYDKENLRVWELCQNENTPAEGSVRDSTDSIYSVKRLSSNPLLKACYKASTASVSARMSEFMTSYVRENAVSEMKLLDFTDAFVATLIHVVKDEFSTYSEDESPFIDKNKMKQACQIIGNTMFFEFKEIFQQTEGVLVVPETNKMENKVVPEQLMHLKLKIKEQDVEFVVDKNETTGKVKRFVSLS